MVDVRLLRLNTQHPHTRWGWEYEEDTFFEFVYHTKELPYLKLIEIVITITMNVYIFYTINGVRYVMHTNTDSTDCHANVTRLT